jgi:hypothetical protein
MSYADRVVAFLQQAALFDLLKRNNVQLSGKQRDKLALVRQGGRSAYDRMGADLDLASLVSQLEELIMCFATPAKSPAAAAAAAATPAPTTSAAASSREGKI